MRIFDKTDGPAVPDYLKLYHNCPPDDKRI